MKKRNLLLALLTAGFVTCATVSCGEVDPKPDDNKQDNGGGNNQPGGNEGGNEGGNNQPGGNEGGNEGGNNQPGGNEGGQSEAQTITATVEEVLALTVPLNEKTPDYYEITGTLEEVEKRTNQTNETTYNFFLRDDTGRIKSWGTGDPIPAGMANATGKKAKVKGKIKNYEGNIQFQYPKVTLLDGSGEGGDTGGDTDIGGNEGGGETSTTPSFDDLTGALSVKEAYNLVKDLPAKGTIGNKYVYGTVSGKLNDRFGNCDLLDDDGTTKLFLYGSESNYKKNKYALGDKILVYGEVKHFKDDKNESFQVTKPEIIEVQKAA